MTGFRLATMMKLVGVIVLALGLLGFPTPSTRARPSAALGRSGDSGGGSCCGCVAPGSARRQARPAYAVITAVAQVGWVTLLLIALQCFWWPARVPLNLGRPSTRSERGFAVTCVLSEFAGGDAIQGCVDTLQVCTIAPAKAEQEFREGLLSHESWRRIRSPRHRHNP